MTLRIARALLVTGLWWVAACNGASPSEPTGPAPAGPGGAAQTGAGGAAPAGSGGATPAGSGGGSGTDTSGAGDGSSDQAPPPYRISSRALVQWKRHAAFEADLMGALELSRDQLCVEVGGKNCIRDVHLVPLGGNEPYESGLMKPSAEPLATTPSVVDRVLLSACSTRARLDAEGPPRVFTALDFKAPLPRADDPALAATIRELYRRLLARDPAPRELELVAALAESDGDGPLSTRDFAALSCFSIASTTEFLFY